MGRFRIEVSLLFVFLAGLSLAGARTAIAGKMVFRSSPERDSIDLRASFDSGHGRLVLSKSGSLTDDIQVEIITSPGRSPAAVSNGQVKLSRRVHLLDEPVCLELAALLQDSARPETIQIRVLAP